MLLQGNRCQPSALRLPPALVVRLGEDRIQRAGHRPLCQPTFHGGQTAAHYSCKEVWMYRWVDLKRKPDPRYTSVCWWIDHLCSGFFPQETWTLWCWPNVTPVCQAPVWTRASATVTPWRPTGAAVLQASRSELWLIFLFCYFFNFYVFISMIYVWKSKKKSFFLRVRIVRQHWTPVWVTPVQMEGPASWMRMRRENTGEKDNFLMWLW